MVTWENNYATVLWKKITK